MVLYWQLRARGNGLRVEVESVWQALAQKVGKCLRRRIYEKDLLLDGFHAVALSCGDMCNCDKIRRFHRTHVVRVCVVQIVSFLLEIGCRTVAKISGCIFV